MVFNNERASVIGHASEHHLGHIPERMPPALQKNIWPGRQVEVDEGHFLFSRFARYRLILVQVFFRRFETCEADDHAVYRSNARSFVIPLKILMRKVDDDSVLLFKALPEKGDLFAL